MPLACYMPQNPHYDTTQYAASCYTKLHKSKYFTHLPTLKHTQFAVISPVTYCVLWPHKQSINIHVYISICTFQIAVQKGKQYQ